MTTRDGTAQFLVLGPTQVLVNGQIVDIGGPKARAMMAVLIVYADTPVTVDRLTALLWDEPPATAVKNIQVHVSRIRQALGPHAAKLATTSNGYQLHTDGESDLQRFDRRVAAAQELLTADPAKAAIELRQAIAMWRGEPLVDLANEHVARYLVPGLDERKVRAVESRIAADLTLGRHDDVVPELRELVAAHPLREQLSAQLMVALYRSGRQAEALEVYARLRQTLADELGLEPSPPLRELQEAVLRQDPSLRAATSGAISAPALPVEPSEPDAPPPLRRRTRTWIATGATAALAIVAATVVLVGAGGRHAPAVRANSIAVLRMDGTVEADVPTGTDPGPIAADGRSVWVATIGDHTLQRVDEGSRKVVKTFGLSAEPTSVNAGDGAVWITNGFTGTLSRVLVSFDQLSSPFFPTGRVAGLVTVATAPGQLWTGLADGTVSRLDPTNLRASLTTNINDHPRCLATDGRDAWLGSFRSTDVRRVDGRTGRVTDIATLDASPLSIAAGDGSVWVATSGADRLWRLGPTTGNVQASIPIGVTAGEIVVLQDAVWIAGGDSLVRVDPATNSVTRSVTLHHPIGGMAVVGSRLWVTMRS